MQPAKHLMAIATVAAATLAGHPSVAVSGEAQVPCKDLTHRGAAYTVCRIDLRRHAIRLFWKSPDGQPYGSLMRLPKTSGASQSPLLFAANAGMFRPDYGPAGLYIENGRVLNRANTRAGHGNFHMKPNGVFYVAGDRAGVAETAAYLKRKLRPDFATQSGPMLVIDGKLHPRFLDNSVSLKRRDGIGVRNARTVFFALSKQEVTFAAFARLFRDRLKCSNALFLDGGSAPTLYFPETKRGANMLPLGPMLAVFQRRPPSAARN